MGGKLLYRLLSPNYGKLQAKISGEADRPNRPELVMEAIKDMSRFTMIKTKNMYKTYTDKIPIHLRLKNLNIPLLSANLHKIVPYNFQAHKGPGHVPQLEKPAELNRMTMNFI